MLTMSPEIVLLSRTTSETTSEQIKQVQAVQTAPAVKTAS